MVKTTKESCELLVQYAQIIFDSLNKGKEPEKFVWMTYISFFTKLLATKPDKIPPMFTEFFILNKADILSPICTKEFNDKEEVISRTFNCAWLKKTDYFNVPKKLVNTPFWETALKCKGHVVYPNITNDTPLEMVKIGYKYSYPITEVLLNAIAVGDNIYIAKILCSFYSAIYSSLTGLIYDEAKETIGKNILELETFIDLSKDVNENDDIGNGMKGIGSAITSVLKFLNVKSDISGKQIDDGINKLLSPEVLDKGKKVLSTVMDKFSQNKDGFDGAHKILNEVINDKTIIENVSQVKDHVMDEFKPIVDNFSNSSSSSSLVKGPTSVGDDEDNNSNSNNNSNEIIFDEDCLNQE